MKVALAKQMHEIDKSAIEEYGLPELSLMESAGHRVFEATSALDEPRELEMYELLRGELPKITIVSVGHRSTLFKVHDSELNLDGAGGYNLRGISQ